ncbi:MAG: hypothetical protein ACKVKT_08800 [Rhodospirillales bacterium]|jgi:hypothetical protein
MRNFCFFLLLLGGMCITAQSAHAACVKIALLDVAGSVIKPNGLVPGIKIGDTAVFIHELPPHDSQREIGSVNCTPEIKQAIEKVYNLSCRSDQAMMQAAESNTQRIGVVHQRCADLKSAIEASD